MGLLLHLLDVRGKIIPFFIITVYMPCSSYEETQYEKSMQQLADLIQLCPKDTTLVIGGDLNASLDTDKKSPRHDIQTIGPYGHTHCNAHGNIVRDFLQLHQFRVCTTFFPKKSYYTWSFAGSGEHPKQLNHIIVRQPDYKMWLMATCRT